MRRVSIAVGAAFAIALCGQASAENFNPQPDPPGRKVHAFNPQPDPPGRHGSAQACVSGQHTTAHGSGGGAGKIEARKAGGEQAKNIGSQTSGAGAGKVQACASGKH